MYQDFQEMYQELQEMINYKFANTGLLEDALTHSSYANDYNTKGSPANILHNETLEFLGDAILDFVIAEYLYKSSLFNDEGDFSKRRAAIVCEKSLAECARKLNLGKTIRLGRSVDVGKERNNPSILSDTLEALFAAVYLDSGLDSVRKVILECLSDIIVQSLAEKSVRDYKTFLQEMLHNKKINAIEYIVIKESGPDHNKVFTSQVIIEGKAMGSGMGSTKKESEQNAAMQAVEALEAAETTKTQG